MSKPLVSILCITYNQAEYIRDALDGFFMQETSFPFEVIVHDDASTDGTVEILQEYERLHPNLRVLYEKENQYSTVAGRSYFHELMTPYVRGRYTALCEGDDYWTDPHKLQRQVTYMEEHPDCLCCGHACRVIEAETGDELRVIGYGEACDVSVPMAIEGMEMQTATLLYRSGLSGRYIEEWDFAKPVGDLPWSVWLCENGIVHYEDAVSSVYRSSSKGSWSAEKDADKLTRNAVNLIGLLDDIDERTAFAYHDVVVARQRPYAIRGSMHAGFSFVGPDGPGHAVRDRLSLKDLVYIFGYRIVSKLRGRPSGSWK